MSVQKNKSRFDRRTIIECATILYIRKGGNTTLHDVIQAVANVTQKDYFDVHTKVKTVLTKGGWIN